MDHPVSARKQLTALALAVALSAPVWASEVRTELSRPLERDPGRAAELAAASGGEVLHLKWNLGGFWGALAGLFVPSHGEALLTFVPRKQDRLEIQLLITAAKRKKEFFLYGADVDRDSGATGSVWSAYHFRDSDKAREQDVEQPDVIDFASALHQLRWNAPETTSRISVWNGGKTYPAEIVPLEPEVRKIAGRKMDVQGYQVRGLKIEDQPHFKDKFSMYFTRDDHAVPVEIIGRRGWIKLRITLVDATELETLAAGRQTAGAPVKPESTR